MNQHHFECILVICVSFPKYVDKVFNYFFLYVSPTESGRKMQFEKQRYDGWYNNLAHPGWGSVGELAIVYMIRDFFCIKIKVGTFVGKLETPFFVGKS